MSYPGHSLSVGVFYHPSRLGNRNDIDRQYVSRKEGGRRLVSIQTRRLYKKEQRKTDYSDQKQHKQYNGQQNNNKCIIEWEEKQMHGHFKRQTGEISQKKT